MKKITNEFFGNVFDDAIIEYTKNRFISDDEIDELKSAFATILEERLVKEVLGDGTITFTVNTL